MWAIFLLISFNPFISSAHPASRLIANICKIVFELPPIAISQTKAFLIAFLFKIFFILNLSSSAISQILLAAALASSSRSGVSAKIVPLPTKAIPIASQSEFIEFAVNIPLQLPPPGQDSHSSIFNFFSSILPTS